MPSRLRREWTAVVGGLPTTFWWLWAGMLFNALATFVFPFLALALRARGWTDEDTGLAVSLMGAGSIVAAPLGGVLADGIGRRRTLLLALVLSGLATVLVALAAAPQAVAVALALLGLVSNLFRPAAQALIADVVAPADRARAFGLLYWAVNVGIAVSLVVGGTLAHWSFRALFLADAATTLLFAALVWRRIPETRPPQAAHAATAPWRGLAAVFRDGVFLAFLGLNVLFAVVLFQFTAAAPLDMARNGVGPLEFGLLMSVNGIVIALLQPFAGRFTGRFEPASVLAVAASLTGLGYGLFALVATPAGYVVAIVIWTVGEVLNAPVAATLSAELAPVALRGRYQGAFGMSYGIAATVAPAVGALALARLGPAGVWGGCIVVGLLAAAGQLAARGARRRRIAALAFGRTRESG